MLNKLILKIQIPLFLILFLFSSKCISFSQESENLSPTLENQEIPKASKDDKIILDALELRDMDINDVLKLISSKTGLNIIAGKNIQGRVTIYLKNVEVHDALTIILKANDLAYVEDEGVIQILPEAEYQQLFGIKFGRHTDHKIIVLRSMKAADAVNLLNQIKSSVGKIVADDQSNTLMIEDVPDKLAYMIDYLNSTDVPTEWRTFQLKHVPVEGVATKITEQVSPKIGLIKFDVASNKIFIKDTKQKLDDFQKLIDQIDIPRETKVFGINYSKAEDIVKTVTPMLSKDIGSIQFDARSNQIIVTDIAPKLEEIKIVITSLDKIEKEVLIDARIIEIQLNDSFNMGIHWDTLAKSYKNLTFTNSFDLSKLPSTNITTTSLSTAKVGTFPTGSYDVILNMIAQLGKVKILSNPHIAVINNQEAKILIGSNLPYATSTTTTPAAGSPTTAENVNFIDVGVKLHVTPTIHDDGYITMKIHPEVSSSTRSYNTTDASGNSNTIPIVDTSEVDTVVRVKDGITIIIGGLIKDDVEHYKNKIPVLGDLPMMGKLFSNEQRSVSKSELVIFLTPHIMSGDANVAPDKYPIMDIKQNKTYYNPFHKINEK